MGRRGDLNARDVMPYVWVDLGCHRGMSLCWCVCVCGAVRASQPATHTRRLFSLTHTFAHKLAVLLQRHWGKMTVGQLLLCFRKCALSAWKISMSGKLAKVCCKKIAFNWDGAQSLFEKSTFTMDQKSFVFNSILKHHINLDKYCLLTEACLMYLLCSCCKS